MGCQAGVAALGELVGRRGKKARATLQRHHPVSGLDHGRTRDPQPHKGRQKTPSYTGHMCIPSKRVGVTRLVGRVGATGLTGGRCRSVPTLCALEPGGCGGMRSPLSFPLSLPPSIHPSIHPGPPDIAVQVVLWLRGPFTKANPKGLLCSCFLFQSSSLQLHHGDPLD